MENVMGLSNEIKTIEEQIRILEEKKKELMVKHGKAYYCKVCGTYVEIKFPEDEWVKERKCYKCWREDKLEENRKKWLKILGGAKIVDIIPHPNPFFTSEINGLIVEKNGKTYELTVYFTGDMCCIDVLEVVILERGGEKVKAVRLVNVGKMKCLEK